MPATDLFARAGRLEAAYHAVDWAATPLGAPVGWSRTLRGTLDSALQTRFPVTLLWGPEFVLLYNEAYAELITGKHPSALGRPAHEVFPEAWDLVGPMMEAVRERGEPTWVEDELIPLERNGFMEECYFTFSYSPVRGRDGDIEGLIDIASETTRQVVAARRLRLLSRLQESLAEVQRTDEVTVRADEVFATDHADLPEAEIRLAPDPRRTPTAPRPPMREILLDEGRDDARLVLIPLPTAEPGVGGTVLAVRLSPFLPADADYLDFLNLIATSLAQAMDRASALEAERGLSTALQLSLLTSPPSIPFAEVAVRYQPAAEVAQIGGDWYDAFTTGDGGLTVVVGDVAGHDREAAAAMAQLRNLVRGVAWTRRGAPSGVLGGLDSAMKGLEVPAVATAVVAQVDRRPHTGALSCRWSNAGHPPPVLLAPDGSTKLLETRPDLLLGLEPSTPRHDHDVELEPGSSLVLYTDGLVERRGVPLDVSLGWLLDALRDRERLHPEELCDLLLRLVKGFTEDDVALLVVRAGR
ncbi:SpoIIE family protein phosphatase [Nocardioides ferulae]|uniref:SpoIIE family protein phosphatase n=1 Tax=Nocardioides ferulae TaxID=2340821 RepID=UPI0013DDF903|nr:SpoIIE family protein phosphatase [Nocardioides ferulae]